MQLPKDFFFFPLKVVCILSSSRKDKYDAIKKYLCTDCPIPSQCVIARTLSKPQSCMAIATKIALQMNCKMGGELWSVEIPVSNVNCFLYWAWFKKQTFFPPKNKTEYLLCSLCCVCEKRHEVKWHKETFHSVVYLCVLKPCSLCHDPFKL